MRALTQNPRAIATRMARNGFPARAKGFTASDWARARWPQKTAAHWAAMAGRTERAAKYWLAGEDPPGVAVTALFAQMTEDLRT